MASSGEIATMPDVEMAGESQTLDITKAGRGTEVNLVNLFNLFRNTHLLDLASNSHF